MHAWNSPGVEGATSTPWTSVLAVNRLIAAESSLIRATGTATQPMPYPDDEACTMTMPFSGIITWTGKQEKRFRGEARNERSPCPGRQAWTLRGAVSRRPQCRRESTGNVYTTKVNTGQRIRKLRRLDPQN